MTRSTEHVAFQSHQDFFSLNFMTIACPYGIGVEMLNISTKSISRLLYIVNEQNETNV